MTDHRLHLAIEATYNILTGARDPLKAMQTHARTLAQIELERRAQSKPQASKKQGATPEHASPPAPRRRFAAHAIPHGDTLAFNYSPSDGTLITVKRGAQVDMDRASRITLPSGRQVTIPQLVAACMGHDAHALPTDPPGTPNRWCWSNLVLRKRKASDGSSLHDCATTEL